MRRLISTFTLVLGFLFVIPVSVKACSCFSPGAPCEAFWNSPAVFSGLVEEVENIVPERTLADGTRVYGPNSRKVRISVIEGFRGVFEREKVVEIKTGGGGGDCGYDFQKGSKYLVYAYKDYRTGALATGICSRTRPLEKAAEDIEYFKSLAGAKPGSRIFGSVYQTFVRRNDAPYVKPQPLAGVTVSAEGAAGQLQTKTDEKGSFEFKDLIAGEYKIGVEPLDKLWGYEEAKSIKVYDKGCAGYSFALQTKTFLSGKLFDEKSEPAAKVSVELVPVDQVNNTRHSDLKFAHTDDEGRFVFRSIPAGKYYLGVRLSGMAEISFPYPQTFFPGTTDLAGARIISVEEGGILENYDFKLPKKLATRKIQGTVFHPDGTPAANAYLSVNETEYFFSFLFRGVGSTKPDGTFSFEIVDGIRYLVKPYVNLKGEQRHAEPIEIPASGDVANLKFVITEPNGNCEKCYRPFINRK